MLSLTDRNPKHEKTETSHMEKAREIDPFGHAGFDPSGKIRLTL